VWILIKILLLEDDANLGASLQRYLVSQSYEVDWAKEGEEAIDLSYDTQYDLYLFDINVPLVNGLDVLTGLREADDFTPTIIISAQIDVESVTQGFIAGADDYVKKPFDPEELLVRIKAKTAQLKKSIEIKGYRLVVDTEEIYYENILCQMGEIQQGIFVQLLRHYPDLVPKEKLMEYIDTDNNGALRFHIAKLKKSTGLEIKSVRGVGYQIF